MKKVLCCLSLVLLCSCAAPNGKLTVSNAELPIRTGLIHNAHPQNIIVTVPNGQVTNMGLLGALASGIANEVSANKRKPGIQAIEKAISYRQINDLLGDTSFNIVKNASWLKVEKTLHSEKYGVNEKHAGFDFSKTNIPTVTTVGSHLVLGEYFEKLTHNFSVHIFEVKDGILGTKSIYTLNLSSVYNPPEGSVKWRSMENYNAWTKDNAALIKEGIKVTTADINQQLVEALKNPHQSK